MAEDSVEEQSTNITGTVSKGCLGLLLPFHFQLLKETEDDTNKPTLSVIPMVCSPQPSGEATIINLKRIAALGQPKVVGMARVRCGTAKSGTRTEFSAADRRSHAR